ncbi:spore germination protein GerPB [Metabacillus idriensis]|uniref:spore germination protein GerPB n=1 Tax=Metabacillus idriensis TaxID=324768 RepID=UPI003D273529
MNFYINQTIQINYLKVDAVSNSSVLQIGSAGIIKPLANLYNTGSFTAPAPPAEPPGGQIQTEGPFVPLAPS